MGDIIDQAQANDELFREAALRNTLASRLPAPIKGNGINRLCAGCKKPIPAKRLKANPAATRCVPCQTIYESGDGFDE